MSDSPPVSSAQQAFPHPRLVLRLGFAGRRQLEGPEEHRLEVALREVFATVGHRLASLAPGIPVGAGQEPKVSAFYAKGCPLLRVVTGLCEGADAIAGRVIARTEIAAEDGEETACLETELAAVLPFPVETYRASRDDDFKGEFDRQLGECAWVMELDGIYDKPEVETKLSKHRRDSAYRAQAAFLLRQSDILVAAADPGQAGKAGGTLETVKAALAFELPVVFIHTGEDGDNVYLIEPDADPYSVLAKDPPDAEARDRILRDWVTRLTADPDSGLDPAEHGREAARKNTEATLAEYFGDPAVLERDSMRPMFRFRKWAWTKLEAKFQIGNRPKSDGPLPPYAAYRKRATALNYHYSGLYRGAFLLNYILAVLAVALATASLVLLTLFMQGEGGHGPGWLLPLLLCLTSVKLVFVAFISRNTRQANKESWNDRAVGYRYLAERLRAMFYLPLAGSFQPQAAAPPQFVIGAVRQSAVDWLFDAIVRSSSPADTTVSACRDFPSHDGSGILSVSHLITLRPAETLALVRDGWIREQVKYHHRNSETMHRLHHAMEKASEKLGRAVVIVVVLDLIVIGGEVLHLVPHGFVPVAQAVTPLLIFVSAVLPAVIAALGGIRFQSECQRLGERSAVMRAMLNGHTDKPGGHRMAAEALLEEIANAAKKPDEDGGSWSHDVLRFTERVASDFMQEAAEWSVLYAKELSDPG